MVDSGLDYSAVSDLGKRMKLLSTIAPKRMEEWLHGTIGPKLKVEMVQMAPVRSGKLRDSIVVVYEPMGVRVGTHGVGYTRFVVEGTRPHEIKPKSGGVLRFSVGGVTVYAKTVRHPGTKPNNFMAEAADKVVRENLPLLGLAFKLERGNG